jgi:dihydroxyacetone kinase-like protein
MVAAIQASKDYLGEVDGLIGDGDHGMNMNKGFTIFGNAIADKDTGFIEGLDELGNILFTQIGGSMGPIYGTIFMEMASAATTDGIVTAEIDPPLLAAMLEAGLDGLHEIVEGEPGDKTLVDTLDPAIKALRGAADAGADFPTALAAMKAAAEKGRDSTRDLIARFGRSSRLGERSRGVLDAGAVSCCVILTAIADGIVEQLEA